ncbi:MAG TPA: thiamine pyrophosphate-dependent enzyme [Candidatus Limnocylindria bacterium]|nr:thiamine pyrophosphate-dependent enzyme [Candidatus Limnocylindria bacterium]
MTFDRVAVVEDALDALLAGLAPAEHRLSPDDAVRPGSGLTVRRAVELFEDQVTSRQVDRAARELKKTNRSFHTITGAGHENNAVLGAQLRITDPAFLHYRSGGFMMARARQLPGSTPAFDALLGIVASREDPIAQGRHKVWGSRSLWVPPQTSTIASHLPKAVGMAYSLARARRLGLADELPSDAIVMCSFGDATVNHATALAAFNTARYGARIGLPMPILFVCEDNQTGISVPTPEGWIEATFSSQPHLHYRRARGDLDEVWDAVSEAIHVVRAAREPLFLHLDVVRLWGHAGSDAEQTYRTADEIALTEQEDPLLRNARRLVKTGAATPDQLRDLVTDARDRVWAAAEEATSRPRLATTEEVTAPLAPYHADRIAIRAAEPVLGEPERSAAFGGILPEVATTPTSRTMAGHLNAALTDELARRPELLLFGEDVARKGGVYNVTHDLQRRFGAGRVFDTLLDETSILGIAQGAAHAGLLPIAEIQYLAYIHNALDQIRGEAASIQFFSSGQFRNPMVVRLPGLAYQKGFGGHFHNDNSVGALRDIPGVVLAVPSNGADAARMLRGSIAMALEDGRVVLFLEPIALYHERDLHTDGDGGWLGAYPPPPAFLLPGEVGVYDTDAPDLLIVSYANGLRMSLQAQAILARDHGVRARVVDLRWLNPLPIEAVRDHAADCGRVLVVDECRATGGGVADALIADLAEHAFDGGLASVRAVDSFVPLGSATSAVLVGLDQVVAAAVETARRPSAAMPRRSAAGRTG